MEFQQRCRDSLGHWNGMEPLAGAMLLDRLDVVLAIIRLDADVCHAVIDHSLFLSTGLSTHR